jgi:hypothetical protein
MAVLKEKRRQAGALKEGKRGMFSTGTEKRHSELALHSFGSRV